MEDRDIFSILEDDKPFKSEQKVLRKDRLKKESGISGEKKVSIKRVKKSDKQEEVAVNPETNFVAD